MISRAILFFTYTGNLYIIFYTDIFTSNFLEGAHTWTPTTHIKLVQDLGVDNVVAEHLAETYGDRAFEVGRYASMTGLRWPVVGKRLNPEYPYIEAEVK